MIGVKKGLQETLPVMTVSLVVLVFIRFYTVVNRSTDCPVITAGESAKR